jgi:transposase
MAFSGRLSDAQWARIAPHLPRRKGTSRGGRPPADPRTCFEGILWILWTGAPWRALPRKYGKLDHLLATPAAVGRGRHTARAVAGLAGRLERR